MFCATSGVLTVQQFFKLIEEANERFQRERHRLASILNGELAQGASLLERSGATLTMYAGGGGGQQWQGGGQQQVGSQQQGGGGHQQRDPAKLKAQLELDPQTGKVNAKSKSEAQSILQAEAEGLVTNARRPNLASGEPNLDFVVDGGYADIKTPVKPSFRSVQKQAADVAASIQAYDSSVRIIIDLKNLGPADKALFVSELQAIVTNMTNVSFINR